MLTANPTSYDMATPWENNLQKMLIYKITNTINLKLYIGLTTVSLKERWSGHKAAANNGTNKHLYNSMRYYGIDKFKIEEIDQAKTLQELGEKERYYIKLYETQNPDKGYNLTAGGERNQYDANPRARLSLDEVIQIREIYSMCELSCKDCWEIYKDKISFSAFQKVWEGTTWKGILDEVYTSEALSIQKTKRSLPGEKNPNSILSNEEVLEIRKYYSTHTLNETFEKFGKNYKSKVSFRGIIDRGYSQIPMYSKINKIWHIKGQEINIEDYKPVSTIPGSGE